MLRIFCRATEIMVGWEWDDNVPCTWHVRIFDATHFLSRYGDHAGVGWGGDGKITLLAHVHIFSRYACSVVLRRSWWGGVGWRWDDITFLAHVHIFGAPHFLSVLRRLWWGVVGWGWDDNSTCTCTHLWCYSCVSWSVATTAPKLGWAKSNQTCVGAACFEDATLFVQFSIQVLAAAALHRKPGIMSVLTALHLYRNDCSKGTISIAPTDAFVPESLTCLDLPPCFQKRPPWVSCSFWASQLSILNGRRSESSTGARQQSAVL